MVMFQLFSKLAGKSSDKTEKTPCRCDGAMVFVWSGGLGGLGHVSLELSDTDASDQPSSYSSIWPKYTPAGGPTSIFPLRAAFSDSMKTDTLQEAARPKEDFADLMSPVEIKPVPPDKILCVKDLDKTKIKREFARIKSGIENEEIRYQLLPGVNTSAFFNALHPRKPIREVYNCVTLTRHLLEKGGMHTLPDASWTTPSKFGDFLVNQTNTETLTADEVKDSSNRMHP